MPGRALVGAADGIWRGMTAPPAGALSARLGAATTGVAGSGAGDTSAGLLATASASGAAGSGTGAADAIGAAGAEADEATWTDGAAGSVGREARYPPAAAAPTQATLSAAKASLLDNITETP